MAQVPTPEGGYPRVGIAIGLNEGTGTVPVFAGIDGQIAGLFGTGSQAP